MSRTLQKDLDIVRAKSIQLREERLRLQAIQTPVKADFDRLEKIRVAINRCRKDERFLSKQLENLRK